MSIQKQVIEVVADCLNLDESLITIDSSSDNIDVWDSMVQVDLMVALENTFDIDLEADDFAALTSVAAIIDFIKNKS